MKKRTGHVRHTAEELLKKAGPRPNYSAIAEEVRRRCNSRTKPADIRLYAVHGRAEGFLPDTTRHWKTKQTLYQELVEQESRLVVKKADYWFRKAQNEELSDTDRLVYLKNALDLTDKALRDFLIDRHLPAQIGW